MGQRELNPLNGAAEILTMKPCSNSWQGGCKGNQANVSESLQVSLAQRSCVVYLGPLRSTWQGKWNERPLVCQVDVMGTTWELLGQGVGRGGAVSWDLSSQHHLLHSCYTERCPCISLVLVATNGSRLRALEGRLGSQKPFKGTRLRLGSCWEERK